MIIDALTALPSTPTTGDELPIERGTTTYKIDYDALATAIINKLGTVLKPADVVDNLNNTATDKPGSANMLKTLNDKITALGTSTALGYTKVVGQYTLSEAFTNFKYIYIRVGYYNSGYPAFGALFIPTSQIVSSTDAAYANRVIYYSGSAVQYADILFESGTTVNIITNTDNQFIRFFGIK